MKLKPLNWENIYSGCWVAPTIFRQEILISRGLKDDVYYVNGSFKAHATLEEAKEAAFKFYYESIMSCFTGP